MAGFDYMDNAHKLPDSANLVLIYVVFKSFYAIDMLLPLALIFAMIGTKIFLIRSNALVAFYALGYSKTDVLRPFIVVSALATALYIGLHATSFARADEFSDNIRRSSTFLKPTTNLFFTYENKYIYFGTLYPLQGRAEDIRVFSVKENSLQQVLTAKEAYYADHYWTIKNADIIQKPHEFTLTSDGIKSFKKDELKILKDFRPKILDQVYEGKVNYTILDAIDAYILLKEQNINTDRVKSSLIKNIFHPLFVPALIVIIFFFVPISPRFLNVTLFSFGAILATLLIWGILFMGVELSNNKTLLPEVGIILPILIIYIVAYIWWRRNRISH